MKKLMLAGMMAAGMTGVWAAEIAYSEQPSPVFDVTVDLTTKMGPVKPMNGVNNGPAVGTAQGDQKIGDFTAYRAARIPYARIHDAIACTALNGHCADITAIFPDFDADENDPKSYDFVFTDHYLDTTIRAGTKLMFQFGETIEHGPKKYGIMPPKDYAKYARICEHIIRHYNEGWGWGSDTEPNTVNIVWSNQFNIVYWEFWNEPDLDPADGVRPHLPRCWGGSSQEFFEFYAVVAKHLKAKFPHLKIGGPSSCGHDWWVDWFLKEAKKNKAPVDFLTWHAYGVSPDQFAQRCDDFHWLLASNGFEKAESIMNEWNYVKGWMDDFVYSLETMSGDNRQKGAAMIAGTMCACQAKPVDMLMFYDARKVTQMNSLFNFVNYYPMQGYYPFYAWSKMADLGETVAVKVARRREGGGPTAATGVNLGGGKHTEGRLIWTTAATDGKGRGALLLVNYSDDNNVTENTIVHLAVPGVDLRKARMHLTDKARIYTEVPLEIEGDGRAAIEMHPWSFAMVEW